MKKGLTILGVVLASSALLAGCSNSSTSKSASSSKSTSISQSKKKVQDYDKLAATLKKDIEKDQANTVDVTTEKNVTDAKTGKKHAVITVKVTDSANSKIVFEASDAAANSKATAEQKDLLKKIKTLVDKEATKLDNADDVIEYKVTDNQGKDKVVVSSGAELVLEGTK